MKRQRSPTTRAKRALRMIGRGETVRLARDKPKLIAVCRKPRDVWRAAGAPANRTVTIGFVKRRSRYRMANEAAKTSVLHHVFIPIQLRRPECNVPKTFT